MEIYYDARPYKRQKRVEMVVRQWLQIQKSSFYRYSGNKLLENSDKCVNVPGDWVETCRQLSAINVLRLFLWFPIFL